MKAVMVCHDALRAHSADFAVAGGMESMSNAPYLLPRRRARRMGHEQLLDHLFFDGLEDAEEGRLMGSFACQFAEQNGFSRAEQDDYARLSLGRAREAAASGAFDWEIAPVHAAGERPPVQQDEGPSRVREARIDSLPPAFRADGSVTAANSSSISDGAAALVLARRSTLAAHGRRPIARLVAHATYADRMREFPNAPAHAVRAVCRKAGWPIDSVDLFEINEAFAVVALAAQRDLGLSLSRVNVHGGACALGHPVGATGARILVTLLGALRRHRLQRGVASLCLGGGEATAVAVEMTDAA
jgi:acetyl-CoA C-acetyltransferase